MILRYACVCSAFLCYGSTLDRNEYGWIFPLHISSHLSHHVHMIFPYVPFIKAFKIRADSLLLSSGNSRQVSSQELVLGWGWASLPYFSLQTAESGQQKEMSKEYEIQIWTYMEVGLSGSEEFPVRKSHPWESSITQGPIRLQAVFNWTSVRIPPGLWLLIIEQFLEKPASAEPLENRQLSNLRTCVCFTNYTQSLEDLHISHVCLLV